MLLSDQTLMLRTRAGVDGEKFCINWLTEERKRLRSTFLYGNCRPPLASATAHEIAAIGSISSLSREIGAVRGRDFYSNQVKVEGDWLSMDMASQYSIGFDNPGRFADNADSTLNTVIEVCENWRDAALESTGRNRTIGECF